MVQEKALKSSLDEREGMQLFDWILRHFPFTLIPTTREVVYVLKQWHYKRERVEWYSDFVLLVEVLVFAIKIWAPGFGNAV